MEPTPPRFESAQGPIEFIVTAPPYTHQSGGVMILHELCSAINRTGKNCVMLFLHSGSADKQDFQFSYFDNPDLYMPGGHFKTLPMGISQITNELARAIIIYPDLITGNPLGAARRCRYLLNFNDREFAGDYVVAYSKIYSKDSLPVLFKPFDDPHLHTRGARPWYERSLDATYIGKGSAFTQTHRIPETILIERNWPKDKEQLALVLRQVRFFYTWDTVSATNVDAIRCGAVPILLHDKQIARETLNQGELGRYPRIGYPPSSQAMSQPAFREMINADMSEFNLNFDANIRGWNHAVENFVADITDHFECACASPQ